MTKVMPNKTVSVSLQSSLNEGSFSTVKDFAETSYEQHLEHDRARLQGTNSDVVPTLKNRKISLPAYSLKDRGINVSKATSEPVLADRKKKQLTLENSMPDTIFSCEETDRRKNTNDNNVLLKKRTHSFTSQDHIDFSARSAFSLTSDTENIATSGLSELSSTIITHQIPTIASNKSKTGSDVGCQKQKFMLNTSLPLSKCLPSVDLPKESEINISMPSSVYGTQPSNIELILAGLNLNKKNMDNEFVSEIEQQIVHLAGGSVNLLPNSQENLQVKNLSQLLSDDNANEKTAKLSEKINNVSQVIDEEDYIISNKLDDLSESSRNSVIDYSSALSITVPQSNLKLSSSQKVSKPHSVVQHISKIIAQNAAIVETTNPIRPRQHVRHLSFSESFNEKEYRKSQITSKIRRYSEDLSSTFNNSPYQSNKSKLHNALLGHSDSPFFLKNSDIFTDHKKSTSYLNGIYTILENENLKFTLSPEEKEKNFLKPFSKSHYTSLSSDKPSNDFISKLEKHSKSEGSIIKDLLLKPKQAVPHSTSEEVLLQQTSTEITKQKTNDAQSSVYLCKYCNIGFHSKGNLEAHQLHYCKHRNQFGSQLGLSLKDMSLIEKLHSSDSPEDVISDKLTLQEAGEIKNFIVDNDGWIPPLKQRKLSEPILSKSHVETPVNRRKTVEYPKSEKTSSPHCIPSVSPGNWNSQMSGGKVQIFDEIGNKNATLKSNLHKSALFTLLDRKSRSSQSIIETEPWTSEPEKIQKFKKMSLPTVVATISKPELNSGGTVMQVHTSTAVVGSSLCVQASSQAPLMATGMSDLNKWKRHFHSADEKMELSPMSKNTAAESEEEKLVSVSLHHNVSTSLLAESSNMSSASEYAEMSSVGSISPSLSHQSDFSNSEKQEKFNKKIMLMENESSSSAQLSITSTSIINTDTITTTSLPLMCVSDSSSALTEGTSIKEININAADNANVNRSSPNKTDSLSDDVKKKCANPSRPTFLPLKKGITLVGSTLISPETPRPKKTSIQLYLGGHAYTSLGLKCSTRSTFCCIYRSQPMYVPQDTDPKLSMYSNWQVLPAKEELFGMTPSQLIGLYNSRQSKENCRTTISVAKMGNTFVCTHSSYWTFRMQDLAKEEFQNSPKIKEKVCDKDVVMEDASLPESSVSIEISVTYSSNVEIGLYLPREQIQLDENSNLSIKEHNHSEENTEENTSHSNIHSPDDPMIQSHPSKRIRHSEGNSSSNDDGTYVRGRGWGKYICEECGIRCKKPSVLKKHIRTHTNLRPYKCYHCAFAFKTKGNLTKHMKSKAHFKKCIELGIVPVPTTVCDSQIDEEALDKQEKLDKDICPSLNSQEFEDGEDIDDDCDDTEHSENEDEDDENTEILGRSERFHDSNNLRTAEKGGSVTSEKEFVTGRDMTEKEGEAAQSLLHLSTCNVSQSSHKLNATKSLSVVSTVDQGEKSKSSILISGSSLSYKISHGNEEYEELIQNQLSSKIAASSIVSSKSLHMKVPNRTEFCISDANNVSDKIFPESKQIESRGGNFETISSSNAEFRDKLTTMWTTNPQSWHNHSLPFYQNSHINYHSAELSWEGQFSDTNASKSTNFVNDIDQPIDLRVCKSKDRISEEIYKSDLYEDWRISQNMLSSSLRPDQKQLTDTNNPKVDLLNHQKSETSPFKFINDINKSCLPTSILNQHSDEENNAFIATAAKQKYQDSKTHPKVVNCHENSIPSYNVGRSDHSIESTANIQNQNQYENPPIMTTEESVDSDSVQCHSTTAISPTIIEENELHMPVISQENSLITVPHNVLRIDNGAHQQRECTNKNGTGNNSYVTEGKCTCAICNKTFTKPSQLRLHVNIHYFERPFRCDDCAISFRTNGHLEKHKRSASHYNKMHTNTSFGTPCADNPRPFKCTDCNIAFRMHGHLAKHLRSKMHIMKLECLGKLPFGMYAEMERTGVNFNDIDTTDCENSLESLQKIAQTLYTPQNAQQSLDLSASSLQTIKPKAHIMNSSYSSATPFQVINNSTISFNSSPVGIQQTGQILNLSSLDITSNDKLRKSNHNKNYLLANEQIIRDCMTPQKEFHGEKLHSDITSPPSLHSRTCPCDSCISLRFTVSNTNSGDSCVSRPVKKEQWKLKDRLIAEFQEESTHTETPR